MVEIFPAITEPAIAQIRELFAEYAVLRNHDAALGNFQYELTHLPGKYAPPSGCVLLATLDFQPAGCIAYQPVGEGICEMKRMFVRPSFRRQGIGSKLIVTLQEYAVQQGYHTMRLDTHPWMKDAHKRYISMGFYEIPRYNENPTPGIRFFEKIIG
ncbi:MAG: GNAT family N-acetyltransferase [Bacteroidia bacterium]